MNIEDEETTRIKIIGICMCLTLIIAFILLIFFPDLWIFGVILFFIAVILAAINSMILGEKPSKFGG
jgi:MFS-type transporter involved in bile tolerance (Atg22 family)